jgi:mannose-6-phosphate isomerase-like protein (cupin superfamily)
MVSKMANAGSCRTGIARTKEFPMRHLAVAVLIIGLALTGPRLFSSLAQEATQMAGMGDMPAGTVGLKSVVLARIAPAAAPGQELQLVRVEVAPGATVSAHTHPGTIALCLESGSVIFGVVEGTATMTQATTIATPEAAQQLTAGTETVLQPGDCLAFDATQTIHTLRNTGGPAVIWQAHLYALGEKPTTFLATPTP